MIENDSCIFLVPIWIGKIPYFNLHRIYRNNLELFSPFFQLIIITSFSKNNSNTTWPTKRHIAF
ncbi:MAG: hypothetical protein ABS69_07140 [Nitrosomonadales bacterium SCN 54-20]|nr:MAG: hypothetical protein ABS69_07140 [Nitrosomonadales bacterium SCN 54-20]